MAQLIEAGLPIVSAADYAPVFVGRERWGWEFRPLTPPRLSPEREHPPQVMLTPPVDCYERPTLHLIGTAALALVGGVLLSGASTSFLWAIPGLGTTFAALWLGGSVSQPIRDLPYPPYGRVGLCVVGALLGLWQPGLLVLVAVLALAYGVLNFRPVLQMDRWDALRVPAREEWRKRVAAQEAIDLERWRHELCWLPARLDGQPSLVGVFGGTDVGWKMLLTTLGGSLLAEGKSVLALELGPRAATEWLAELARTQGFSVEVRTYPADCATSNLLTGLTWADLTDLIVEAAAAAGRARAGDSTPQGTSFSERQHDRGLLREIAGALDPAKPVSFGRLRAALLAVLGERERAEVSQNQVPVLEPDEARRLTSLYGSTQVERTSVLERVRSLAFLVHDLVQFDAPADLVPSAGSANLRVLRVDGRVARLDRELTSQVLVQLLLFAARQARTPGDVVIATGMDRVPLDSMETLHSHVERDGGRLVALFEHLRDDAVAVLGTGGATAGFMALGPQKEAHAAVEFVGDEFRWVTNQITRGISDAVGTSQTQQRGQSITGVPIFNMYLKASTSDSYSVSVSASETRTISNSEALSRVYEHVLEPGELQGLAPTELILVQVRPRGQRRIVHVDVNAALAAHPRTLRDTAPAAT